MLEDSSLFLILSVLPVCREIAFNSDSETQGEMDELWEKLSEGGSKSQCGWLKDQFSLSWQIIPTALTKQMGGGDPAKARRVMQAMLKMTKIDIAALQRAYDGQ